MTSERGCPDPSSRGSQFPLPPTQTLPLAASVKHISVSSEVQIQARSRPSTATANADSHVPQDGISNSQVIADDDGFSDEAYAESSNSGDWSSLNALASELRRGVVENGRVYPTYGGHEYGMPVDEEELDRNNLQHTKFSLLLGDRAFLAPISPSPTRILDIGTGSGIWVIDMAGTYPMAEVIGTDIAPVQPNWVPPNVQFFLEDAEDTWTFSPNTFDLVFSRETSFAIRDWSQFISQAWTALKPDGWLELCATHPQTCCDDTSLDLSTSHLAKTARVYLEIGEATGATLEAPYTWAQQMRHAGFVDVEECRFKMPLGPWAKDKRLKKIGAFELASLDRGFEAYIARGWTRVLRRPIEECHALIAEARREANNPRYHTYCYFVVVVGRKPAVQSSV